MRISNKAHWCLALFLTVGSAHAAQRTVTPALTTTNEPADPQASPINVEPVAGFTITESVPVTDEGRADYEAAVRMLEKDQYESGITLLLKVTEQAPELTAPHINLGIAYARTGDLDHA